MEGRILADEHDNGIGGAIKGAAYNCRQSRDFMAQYGLDARFVLLLLGPVISISSWRENFIDDRVKDHILLLLH